MTNRSLHLDPENRPHVAYGGEHLYYASFDGAEWHVEIADDSPYVGRYASLALDSAGYPHIGYYDAVNESLKHAHWTGERWEMGLVADMGTPFNSGGVIALALDAEGTPHISYYDADDGAIKYAQWVGEKWSIQTIAPTGEAPVALSMILDTNGVPHVGYRADGLNYARRAEQGWEIQLVDGGETFGSGDVSIALDSLGLPHIGYYVDSKETMQRSLRHAFWTGTEWNIQAIGNTEEPGGRIEIDHPLPCSISLALDSNNLPHLVYGNGDTVMYAHWASNWSIQVVDDWRGSGCYVSIALDASNYPYISYRDAIEGFESMSSYGGLKVARWTITGWDIQVVDSGGSVGSPAIAIDSKGDPHISYPAYYGVQYAHWVDGAWEIQTVTETREDIWGTLIVLDALDRPHISYGGREEMYYAEWTEDGWSTQPVDDSPHSAMSLALDATGSPHLSYYDYDNDLLKHAYWTEKGWEIRVVGSISCIPNTSPAALDSAGGWHIVCGGPERSLQYAYLNFGASQWITKTIGDGFSPVLSLDTSGQPHVSYLGYTEAGDGVLQYTHKADNAWETLTVDDIGKGGISELSLDMDTSGSPHLVYYKDWPESTLNYAHWTGTEWDIRIIDDSIGTLYVPALTAIEVDSSGRAHICYLDPLSNDLLYVRTEP